MATRTSPRHQRPVVEALEPKLLYSADTGLSAFLPDAAQAAQTAQAALHQTLSAQAVTSADMNLASEHPAAELVFIDATVPDLATLKQDLQQQAAQGRAIEVIVIQADEDGLSRITQTLQNRHDISAIHLIGHGEAGDMQLGSTPLDAHNLMTRASEIAQWGAALRSDGDLLLYGCDVGASAAGRDLIDNLAALTGADVAASDDLTGAASLGGDWLLEVRTGHIEAASLLSAQAQTQWDGVLALATPATKGTAVWAESGFTTPQQGGWDGLTLGAQSDTATSSTWTVMTSAESPTRNEAIVVGVDSSGIIRGERWNGTQWQTLPMDPIASGTLDYRQGFAVSYEQQSGDAMLVWNDGSALRYSVFNGTSWTTSKQIDAFDGAAPQRMQIASQAKGDSMVLLVSDANADDYALIWNGSSWGHAITLDTSGTTATDQISSAVAYEGLSGKAMVAYAKANNANIFYRTFDGNNWSDEAAAGNYTESAAPRWLTLASDPGSNRIGMGLLSVAGNNTNQVSFSIWSGSSWGSRTIPGSYTDSSPGSPVALAFESRSGDLLAVYGTNSANTRYLTWNNSSGWSSAANGPNTAQPGSLRLYSDPYTDHIMMGVQAKDGSLSFTDWTGSAFGSVNTVATTSGSTVTPAFTWLWASDMSGNKTNTLLLGGSAASSGWHGVNTVGASEVLEFTDPGLSYGAGGTSGTFSHVVDLAALGVSGLDDIAWVSRDVTLTSGVIVHRGDMLFTTTASSTLVNSDGSTVSVNNNDVVLFRPTVAGQYDKGTFTLLVQGLDAGLLGLGSPNIRGLALVEQDTTVGDVTLTAGTILFTSGTTSAAADIKRFVPGSGGLLGGLLTGNVSTVIAGSEVGIGQAITGLEIVSNATPLKNVTLPAGSLLISLEASDTIATNNLSLAPADVAILSPTRTSVNSTAVATASLLMRGSSVGASGKVFDTLALSLDATPVITSNGGTTFVSLSLSENSTTVTTVTATDADTDTKLTYSIAAGTDASLFQINASTGALRFINAPDFEQPADSNHDNVYQVVVVASDGTYLDTQVLTVTVSNVNEAPVISSDGGGTFSVLTVTEGGTSATQVQATDQDAGDTLTYTVSGTDASLFHIDAATGLLTFNTATDFAAPLDNNGDNIYAIQVNATDNHGLADTQLLFIRVLQAAAPPNATPVITSNAGGNDATLSINEDSTAVTTVQATDADSTTLTYGITGGADQALFDIDPLTGVLSFHTAPHAAQPGDSDQDNVYEVTVSASDGASGDTQDLHITVLAYNQPPLNTLPASFDTSEDSALTLTGLSVADNDAAGADLTVTLSVQHGSLGVIDNASGGLSASQIAYSTDHRQVTLTGTAAAINATLSADQGVVYLPDTDYNGSDTLSMVSNDHGASGVAHSPAQTTDTDTAVLAIATVDDAPVWSGSGGSVSYTENAPALAIDTGLTLSDIDTTTFHGATVEISAHFASGQDTLLFTNQAGITGAWDTATGVLTLSGDASAADYQTALRSITYRNDSDNPDTSTRTVTFRIGDDSTVQAVSRDITITAINDAPVVTAGGSALAYTENDAPAAIAPALTLTDVDNSTFNGATVQITGHYTSGQDVLSFSAQAGITGSWDASTGTLTLSGNASTADYQAALRSVAYSNTADAPDATARTVTFSVNDGSGAVTATQGITLTAVNDAPVLLVNSLSIQQGGTATPDIQAQDPDTVDTALTLTASHITGGYFFNTSTQGIVTQFSYGAVQAGHIQFVQDGSATAPGYDLVLGDGALDTAPSSASISFTVTPTDTSPPQPPTQPPPPPPPQQVDTVVDKPAAEPTQAPAQAAAAPTATAIGAASAPLVAAAFVPEPLRPANLNLDSNAPFNPIRPVADTPVRNSNSGEAAAVAAEAFQFSWAGDLQTTTNPEELRRNLDALRDQLQDQGTERRHVVASSIALTTGLSVGYVIWLVRGGALVGSMLSAMPAWQMVDPLPVLTRGRNRSDQMHDGDDDASVEHLFDGQGDDLGHTAELAEVGEPIDNTMDTTAHKSTTETRS